MVTLPHSIARIRTHQANCSVGKQWHAPKKAFRPTAGLKSYEKRTQERALMAQVKAKEKEMKDEKEQERQVCPNSPHIG
jgi:hypothetical protein